MGHRWNEGEGERRGWGGSAESGGMRLRQGWGEWGIGLGINLYLRFVGEVSTQHINVINAQENKSKNLWQFMPRRRVRKVKGKKLRYFDIAFNN